MLPSGASRCDGFVEFKKVRLPKPRHFVHVLPLDAEQMAERVAARKRAREQPSRPGVWHQTQSGALAQRA